MTGNNYGLSPGFGKPVVPASAQSVAVSSAANVQLGYLSAQIQNINLTFVGGAVVLGAANTYPAGGQIYLIRNTGVNNFDIQDFTGQVVFAALSPNKSVVVWLRNNTTIAGQWSLLSNQGVQNALNAQPLASFLAAAVTGVSICNVSPTQSLLVYTPSSTSYVQLVVITLAGASISVGTAVAINATQTNPSGYAVASVQIGTGLALVVTGETRAYVVSVSGTVPTVLNSCAVYSASVDVSVSLTGSNTALVLFSDDSTNIISSSVLTYTTAGDICVAGLANSGAIGIIQNSVCTSNIGTDSILVTYQIGTTVYGYVLTGSGGLYTKGTTYTLINATAYATNAAISCSIGGGNGLLFYNDTANSNYLTGVVIVNTAGVLSVGAKQQIQAAAGIPLTATMTATNAAIVLSSSSFNLYGMTISGSTITVGSPVVATTANSTNPINYAFTQSNTNKAVLSFVTTGGNLYSAVVSMATRTITYNAAVSPGSGNAAIKISAVQVNTDLVAIAYYSSFSSCIAVSSSTTTATFGSNQSSGVSASVFSLAQNAATNSAVMFIENTVSFSACVFTFSGTAVTLAVANTTTAWGNSNNSGTNDQIVGCYSSSGLSIFAVIDTTLGNDFYTLAMASTNSTVTVQTLSYIFNSSTPGAYLETAPYGSGTAIVCGSANNSALYASIATLSGYAVSYGPYLSAVGAVRASVGLSKLGNSASWILVWDVGGTSTVSGVLTQSGGSLSLGPTFTLASVSESNFGVSVVAQSATQAIASYYTTTNQICAFELLSISGTTITEAPDGLITITTGSSSSSVQSMCNIGYNVLVAYAQSGSPSQVQLIQTVKE